MAKLESNPYAPPKADPNVRSHAAAISTTAAPDPAALRSALARLAQHVASPDAVAADLAAAGPRIRPVTWVMIALTVVLLVAAAGVAATQPDSRMAAILCGVGAFFFAILAGALGAVDASFVPRTSPDVPEKALRRFLKGLASGRHGYAWAMLSPTAREQVVRAPDLGPIPTGEGTFSLARPEDLKPYALAFARPGQKVMRTLRVKSATAQLFPAYPDVAIVTAEVAFQSWPVWLNVLFGISAAVFRPLLIVAAILFFVMRKRHNVTVAKTLLQGQPGVWYLLDGNLIETPPAL